MGGSIANIIQEAQKLGAEFRVKDDGRLLVRQLSALPDDIQQALRSHKLEVITYLLKKPVIWKGTPDEYHKLLMVRKAELLLAEARLTGNPYIDWHTRNQIRNLEIKIADLRRLLKDATGEESDSPDI
jgi:hypothetical protein